MQTILDLELIETIISNSGRIEGISRNTLKNMLLSKMFNDEKFIIADIENGKLQAFTFATIETLDGQDVCFVQAHYSMKAGMTQVMLDKLIQWAQKRGLSKIVFMTKRNPKAWERKYKFNKIYSVMERLI